LASRPWYIVFGHSSQIEVKNFTRVVISDPWSISHLVLDGAHVPFYTFEASSS